MIQTRFFVCLGLVCLGLAWASPPAQGADWPMWRGDAARSADWSGELAETLYPQWVLRLPPLEPAYQNPRLQFDLGYEPIVSQGRLFVGSSRNDSVTAYDVSTGREQWRFAAEGPVRFAPVAWRDRVYFGSDDGFVYCLKADSGALVWKFRAVPSQRKLLGNGRLISAWPVRGGPVIADDTLYFAAGVWSFEGVFVYALDPQTGDVKWVNDRTGYIYGQHPHDTQAFGGLTPQGYLVVQGDELIIPCGTALPARFQRETGTLKSFDLPKAGRSPGGWFAASLAARRGATIPESERLLLDPEVNRDRHEGGWNTGPGGSEGSRARVSLNEREYDFSAGYPGVEGTIHSLLAANERLFVVTREGEIHCFGPKPIAVNGQPRGLPAASETRATSSDRPAPDEQPARRAPDEWTALAESILTTTAINHGYVLVAGIGSGGLIEELARQSEFRLLVVDADAGKCAALRDRLDELDLPRARVGVYQGNLWQLGLPPYLATLVVSEDLLATGFTFAVEPVTELYRWLRPFEGLACLDLSDAQRDTFFAVVQEANLPAAATRHEGGLTLLARSQAPPGATNYIDGWTSRDEHVKAPLGVLWFDDKTAHFKRAPQPMIVDGVMISYDKDWLGWTEGVRPPYKLIPPKYSDIYTGRVFEPEEASRLAQSLPTRDITQKQLEQYRPPTQTNPWSPPQPVIGERVNPLNGRSEPRAIHKQYGCDGGVDYGHLYTLRSGTAAFYDKRLESGTIHISGPRSGCTNSVIPAGGILNVPYFYQGCTCSYPLPVGLALISLPPEHEQWAVWGEGSAENLQRVGINFGAPGTRMTSAGTLWLEQPHAGGPAPKLDLTITPEHPATFYHHSLWVTGGTGWPWVSASGISGVQSVTLRGIQPGSYTVRLHFAEPEKTPVGARLFDVSLNGTRVLERLDLAEATPAALAPLVREFPRIPLEGELRVEFTAIRGEPVIGGIELVPTDQTLDDLPTLSPPSRSLS
ncbi:MAG: PQQ-binding-like beta-propeller repeat protein [Planctomycetaceae bacterium]